MAAEKTNEKKTSLKREPIARLPQLYRVARKVLIDSFEHKSSVKALLFHARYPIKGALSRLVYDTLANLQVLDALRETVVLPLHPNIDQNTTRILLCELLFGTGVLPIGTQKAEILTSLYPRLEQELIQLENSFPNLDNGGTLPRYVRVNTLKTTRREVAEKLKNDGFEYVKSRGLKYTQYLDQIRSLQHGQYLKDPHVPNLLVFHIDQKMFAPDLIPGEELMMQNKASCLASLALSPPPGSIVVDACAAPGMKATHLAALMENEGKLIALDKCATRTDTLRNVLSQAGVKCAQVLCADFTTIKPTEPPYSEVEYILVDPSCSGSGMACRALEGTNDESERLQSLANFQCVLLKHAMSFPSVKRIVYSTCSIFDKENEEVISDVMGSYVGQNFKLVRALPGWTRRSKTKPRTLRCDLRKDLCVGFYVAVIERRQ